MLAEKDHGLSEMSMFLNRLRSIFPKLEKSMEDGGERVDIHYDGHVDYDRLNMYQKSHYRRYEFALEIIPPGASCGDFACGTGYGAVMLTQRAHSVVGGDINSRVIETIRKRYRNIPNVEFVHCDLLSLKCGRPLDWITSFETIEHFDEQKIPIVLRNFRDALKPGGQLVFSVPYSQQRSENALSMGFHKTFCIVESKIESWLKETGFRPEYYRYQDYQTHVITEDDYRKDFIICIARKLD